MPQNHTQINYRPDIDGLRALAVLSVVLFHAFPEWIHGGFIGVDIFFVISGYLISSIIFKNLENKSFSFADFYIRRIKRIFPALIVVLISSLFFGWFVLLADEYQQLAKHTIGASTFTNNFMLWQESGYFDNDADTKPFLHLWSLSVEEQFYLAWPLLLCFFFQWKQHLKKILLVLTAGFILIHFYIFHPDRVAAFYTPYARFYELLVGACIGYAHLYPKNIHIHNLYKRFKSIQSFIGLALVLIGIQIITKESHFPGYYALLSPVLGTALIIDSPKDSILNKYLFSNKLMVWLGLISYPLYLWHWPLLSFANIIESQTPNLISRALLVVIAIFLAALTYLFIEKPIRLGSAKISERKVIVLILFMLLVGITGGIIYLKGGVQTRKISSPTIKNIGDTGHELFFQYTQKHFFLCTPKNIQNEALSVNNVTRCFQSKKNQPIDIAIIGDSHAEQIFIGLAEAMPNKNVVYYIQHAPPIMGHHDLDHIFEYVMADKSIKTVILNAFWSKRKKELPKNTSLSEGLSDTIKQLLSKNKQVIVLDDVPVFSFNPRQCEFIRPLSFTNNCNENKSTFDKKYNLYGPSLELSSKNSGAQFINTVSLFCDNKVCSMEKNGQLLYRDSDHLNINGSRYIGKFIAAELMK